MHLAMRILCLPVVFLACLLSGAPLTAAEDAHTWPFSLRVQMLRLAEVDWRSRVAAAAQCPRRVSGIGVMIDHAGAYAELEQKTLARTLRLGDLPQVVAVVAGSPAARSGLRPGDEIVAIGKVGMAKALMQSPDPALFAEDVTDLIEALPTDKPATLVLRRGKASLRKTVVPIPICSSRTTLETGRLLEAYSDSDDLAVTSALIDFTENDDELALIVGHELAHVILNAASRTTPVEPLDLEQNADQLGALIAHLS